MINGRGFCFACLWLFYSFVCCDQQQSEAGDSPVSTTVGDDVGILGAVTHFAFSFYFAIFTRGILFCFTSWPRSGMINRRGFFFACLCLFYSFVCCDQQPWGLFHYQVFYLVWCCAVGVWRVGRLCIVKCKIRSAVVKYAGDGSDIDVTAICTRKHWIPSDLQS